MKWLDNRIVDKALKIVGRSADPSALTINWTQLMGGAWLPTDASAAAQQAYGNLVWVWTCVRAKAQFGAMVPLRVYEIPRGKDESAKVPVAYDHPAQTLLRKVNPRYVRFNLIEQMIGYGNLTGKMLVLKQNTGGWTKGKPPDELWTLRPDYLHKINFRKGTGLIESYDIGAGGETKRVLAEQLIYIANFNPYSDADGLAATQPLNRTMQTEIYAQDHNKNLLKEGGVPKIALTVDRFLLPDQQKAILLGWFNSFSGKLTGRGPGQTALAFGGVKPQALAQTALEMDMMTQRDKNRDEIISAFGCYPAVVGVAQADRSRAEADMRMFAQNTMVPELTLIAEYFTEFLMPDFGDRLVCAFDYSQVPALKDDETAKAAIVSQLITNRIFSPNEIRQKFYDEKPYKGGDEILVPFNMVPGGSGATEAPRAKRAIQAVTHTPAQAQRLAGYARRLDAVETQARKWLAEMFTKQEALCLGALERSRRDMGDLEDIIGGPGMAETTRAALKRVILAAAEQGIEHGLEPLADLGIGFDLTNPALVKWMETHVYEASRFVNSTTGEALKTIISNAQAEGLTMSELTEKIRSGMTAMFDEAKAGRAYTIARTEVQQGIQTTQMIGWRESGIVEQKEWIASLLGNGRHNEMHGQVVAIDEPFVHPGGEFCDAGTEFDRPGGSGLPEQDINCQCDMAPVVSERARMEYLGRKLERKLYPAVGKGSRTWETKRNAAKVLLGS